MAWTVAFALWARCIFSMLIAPALASFPVPQGRPEWRNPVMTLLTEHYRTSLRWAIEHRLLTVAVASLGVGGAVYLAVSGIIGSEFLPHLDEGALWVRGTLAPSTGPTEGIASPTRPASCSARFPEVTAVHQPGRPPRRRHRRHRLLQHRIFRRLEAQGAVAPVSSTRTTTS